MSICLLIVKEFKHDVKFLSFANFSRREKFSKNKTGSARFELATYSLRLLGKGAPKRGPVFLQVEGCRSIQVARSLRIFREAKNSAKPN